MGVVLQTVEPNKIQVILELLLGLVRLILDLPANRGQVHRFSDYCERDRSTRQLNVESFTYHQHSPAPPPLALAAEMLPHRGYPAIMSVK